MGNENNMGCDMVGLLDIKGQDQCRRVYSVDGIAPTLTTSGGGGQRQVKIFDTSRLRVRKLTPKEYGILQAFPMENWKQVVSDSQAYKQFGNAVTTTVFTAIAEEIAKSIYAAEESEEINMEETRETEVKGLEDDTEEITAESILALAEAREKEATAAAVTETQNGNIPVEEMAAFITETLFNETLIPGILYDKINESILQTLKQEFDGKTVGEQREVQRDWETAKKALNEALEKYASMGPVGMYGIRILSALKMRIDQGENTPDLFNAIVEAAR